MVFLNKLLTQKIRTEIVAKIKGSPRTEHFGVDLRGENNVLHTKNLRNEQDALHDYIRPCHFGGPRAHASLFPRLKGQADPRTNPENAFP